MPYTSDMPSTGDRPDTQGEKTGRGAGPVECSVIVPLYNEEAVIGETCRRLKEAMDAGGASYEILLVNDGSRDRT
ncbi:MAG: glycosyltransferase, partial [Clostridiales bacterium]|nr:glycosyltransferase [Clostridiales bacterium]